MRCKEVGKNLTCVYCKLARSAIICGDNLFPVDVCDDLLNQCLFKYTDFMENLEIPVVHSFKFVQCSVCGVVGC